MFSNQNGIKLEINKGKTSDKFQDLWKGNNTLLNNLQVNEKVTGKIRKYFEKNKNENTIQKNLLDLTKSVL